MAAALMTAEPTCAGTRWLAGHPLLPLTGIRGATVGAGPGKHFDIVGIQMFDSCEIRVHPTGKALARIGVQQQGHSHETTFAQIIAAELGLSPDDVDIEHGDTDTAPYGLGTYGSRSTPVAGAATALAVRKVRDKARKIAAHLLEISEDDLEWEPGRFFVKGAPDRGKTIQELAFAAYTNCPPFLEPGLEALTYYDPPNLTYPFGSYICVVDIDRGTGVELVVHTPFEGADCVAEAYAVRVDYIEEKHRALGPTE